MMMLRPCCEQPCANLVEKGCCAVHEKARNASRGTTAQRGYGSDWERVRLAKLAANPICEIRTECQGAIATQVDHIVPIERRPDLRLEWANLQSCCKACNVAKANAGREATRRLGWRG